MAVKRKIMDLSPISEKIQDAVAEKAKNIVSVTGDTVSVSVNINEMVDEYLKEKEILQPRIYITTMAYTKLRTLVNRYSKEIGMYGTVEHLRNTTVEPAQDNYIITDILVYPQKTTGVTCEQDEDKMFEFEMSLTTEQVNSKRFHIHSHVNMSTGPSGVDEDFYSRLMTQVNDYFIIAITNKSDSYFTRFYDVVNNIIYEDIPIWIIKETGESIDDWYTKQIDDNITEQTYTTTTPAVSAYQNYPTSSKVPKQNSGYYQSSFIDDEEDEFWNEFMKEDMKAKSYNNHKKGRGRPRKEHL